MNKLKLCFILLLLLSPITTQATESKDPSAEQLKIQEGVASYYGRKFHLRKTANGEVFNMEAMTAAHKSLPFGTMLKVTNSKNGKEVWVRINDRLPQNSKRIIDLSRGAAKKLDMIRDGIVRVSVEVPDSETVLSLMEHFQNGTPEGIRLRIYENPIVVNKLDICSMEVELEVKATASI